MSPEKRQEFEASVRDLEVHVRAWEDGGEIGESGFRFFGIFDIFYYLFAGYVAYIVGAQECDVRSRRQPPPDVDPY
jgi:hypothetical protein